MKIDGLTNKKLICEKFNSVCSILKPPQKKTPTQWAEENIIIPHGNAKPGPLSFNNSPYWVEPLNLTVADDCERITLECASQVGKTLFALCVQAYHIAYKPSNQMFMQPTQNDINIWLETKFNPLAESTPAVDEVLRASQALNKTDNVRIKSYIGGALMLSWAGSPKTMRGRSAPLIICDEADGYTNTKEGHPVNLLWQRAATFKDDRLLIEISTPTIHGGSWIDKAYNMGDQRKFFVPCMKCGKFQILEWENVTWGKHTDETDNPKSAKYVCIGCGVLWNDRLRIASIRKGKWRSKHRFRGHASYHLNELYSCFRPLASIVTSYLEKKAVGDLQSFINVSLAKTYNENEELNKAKPLINKTIKYKAEVPEPVLCITAGVDMQGDRLECEITGWTEKEISYSIAYRIFWGDPLAPKVWEELENYLLKPFQHETQGEMFLLAGCVDTGGNSGCTQAAYNFLKGKHLKKIFAIKGISGWGRPIVGTANKKKSGYYSRPVLLYMVGVDEAKLVVTKRLQIEDPEQAGYCYFSDDRTPEYFEQLQAERLVTRFKKGYLVKEWKKTRPRNEALDCRVYSYAALKIIDPNLVWLAEKRKQEQQQQNKNILQNNHSQKQESSLQRYASRSRKRI